MSSCGQMVYHPPPGVLSWTEQFGINSYGSQRDSYNEAFLDGSLSDSKNTVLMSLIFKKGDHSNIKNYRPISLANVDYKILAFQLANGLQSVLDKLISHDQTGYIKGSFIGSNIRKTLDVIDYFFKKT